MKFEVDHVLQVVSGSYVGSKVRVLDRYPAAREDLANGYQVEFLDGSKKGSMTAFLEPELANVLPQFAATQAVVLVMNDDKGDLFGYVGDIRWNALVHGWEYQIAIQKFQGEGTHDMVWATGDKLRIAKDGDNPRARTRAPRNPPLTVAALIAVLQRFPADALVIAECNESFDFVTEQGVELEPAGRHYLRLEGDKSNYDKEVVSIWGDY